MADRDGASLARSWSTQLGLAYTPLLDQSQIGAGDHFALLDGIEGSFALSTTQVEASQRLDWTWSSHLSSHVEVDESVIQLRQLDTRAPVLQFKREVAEHHLDRFFDAVLKHRVAPPVTIIDHVVDCFRSHRHTARDRGLTDDHALRSFLELVHDVIVADESGASAFSKTASKFPPEYRERFVEELSYNQLTGRHAKLGLTIRHAAGSLFQEAHAELTSAPAQMPLFGLARVPHRPARNQVGAYYTPPGLARVLADLSLRPHLNRGKIRIFDPACGSGIFLCEAIRSLERCGYKGSIEVIGHDISASAVEMALFALKHSDLPKTAKVSITVADFLSKISSVEADVVLMNPPFIAFQDLDAMRREKLQRVLGDIFKYRPDYSVLFVMQALRHLRIGGTLATLLPSGVLSQKSASGWREEVQEANSIDLVAVLGDHGLFRDAMVNIAALMLTKTEALMPKPQTTMLWAGQKSGASAAALRRLRRWANGDRRPEQSNEWAIYTAESERLVERENWLPRPNSLGDMPERLSRTRGMLSMSEVFHIELGIRVGDRKRFIISEEIYGALNRSERRFFRPIAEKGAIAAGRINPSEYLFYPPEAMSLSEVKKTLPTFHAKHLAVIGPGSRKFEIERPRRDTMESGKPRIVSRAFVSTGSFAVDPKGEHVVVQGYSWLPQGPILGAPFPVTELLADYSFIFNSRIFFLLLREYGRIVAGGQVDVNKQSMKDVPVPDLARLYLEDSDLKRQADMLREQDAKVFPPLAELDRFAAAAYRTALDEWPPVS